MDIDVLRQIAQDRSGLASVDEVATGLGCESDEARQRLDRLVQSGHLAGPMLAKWASDEWRELGYGVLPRGRDALEQASTEDGHE